MAISESLSATEFKAKCLEILDRVSRREIERVAITKRGRVAAVLVPPADFRLGGGSAEPSRNRAQFRAVPKTWFARFMASPAIKAAQLTPEVAVDASWLPTARHLGAPVVTRDSKIIAYGRAGHVAVIPC